MSVLRTCKLVLAVVGHLLALVGEGEDEGATHFRHAVHDVFIQVVEPALRSVANKVACSIFEQV